MAESNFLSFLVDETFKLQQSGEGKLSSFELKLTDYNLGYLKGEFIPQTQVLRFKTPFGILDAPINWSVFSLESHPDQVILDEYHDLDHFFTVLRKSWDGNFEKFLITHADGFCYIVGLRVGEDAHIHDLTNPQVILKSA